MREVNNAELSLFKQELKKVLDYLLMYLKNPVQAIRFLPEWQWPTLLAVIGSAAAISGTVAGILQASIGQTLLGLLIFPISATISVAIISGFYYYSCFFLFKRKALYQRLFTLVILASFPTLVLNLFSAFLPPINLLGLFISSILLIVGLSDNFMIDRKSTIKLVFSVYIIYVLIWIGSILGTRTHESKLNERIQPKSLEILKQELDDQQSEEL